MLCDTCIALQMIDCYQHYVMCYMSINKQALLHVVQLKSDSDAFRAHQTLWRRLIEIQELEIGWRCFDYFL